MASFPTSVKTFPTLVDLVDSVLASHQNERGAEVTAIETFLTAAALYAGFGTPAVMAGTVVLTDASPVIQSLDPNGAARDLTLPAIATTNHVFIVINRAAGSYAITIKNAGGTTIATCAKDAAVFVFSDGVNRWSSIGSIDTSSFATLTGVQTLTNKAIQPRVSPMSGPGATPTYNIQDYDVFVLFNLVAAITDMSTNQSGTPYSWQKMMLRFSDDGTARALTFGAKFSGLPVANPTTTEVGKYTYVFCVWNASRSGGVWDTLAVATG